MSDLQAKDQTPDPVEPDGDESVTVVNVFSTAYSGSTLLNILLGSHSSIFCAGELRSAYDSGEAICTLHGFACPLWSKFELDAEENPFVQISNLTGKKLLVVSGSRRLLEEQDDDRIVSRFIHLIRDGRDVTMQYLRENRDSSMRAAASAWVKTIHHNEKILSQFDEHDVFESVYESLRDETETELTDICKFLGLSFEKGMLDRSNRPEHYLGGKIEVVRALTARRQGYRARAQAAQRGMDELTDFDLVEGEAADDEMSGWQSTTFNMIAGRLNKQYGYE